MFIAPAFYTTSKQTQSNNSQPEKNHLQLQRKQPTAKL